LASAKVDLMAVNSQLLEAIQQKLHQQKELEAWQVSFVMQEFTIFNLLCCCTSTYQNLFF